MGWVGVIPMLAGAAAPLVLLSIPRYRSPPPDRGSTYRWPRGTVLFCLIGLYAAGALVMAQSGAMSPFAGKTIVAAYFFLATVACVYLHRFRVIVDGGSVRVGAFSLKRMDFADVVQARYVQAGDSGKIVLRAASGARIHISETINGFDDCAAEINSRLPDGLSIPSAVYWRTS